MSRRVVRAAFRIVVYMIALFVAQLAFADKFDHTEAYVQNFMFTIMVIVEAVLLLVDKQHA
jgi:hypothetical protein